MTDHCKSLSCYSQQKIVSSHFNALWNWKVWPRGSVTLVTNRTWTAISWVAFVIKIYKILTKWFAGCVLVFCSHFSVFCFSHWVEIKSHWVLSRSFPWWEFFKNTKYFISHNSYSKTTSIKICNESSCNQVVPKSPIGLLMESYILKNGNYERFFLKNSHSPKYFQSQTWMSIVWSLWMMMEISNYRDVKPRIIFLRSFKSFDVLENLRPY